MYRRTDRQLGLMGSAALLPASAKARLGETWAEGFRAQVLPVLLSVEDEFRGLYCADNGRPNWSVARALGIVLLASMTDLPDQDALDALSFDLRWHRALDLRPEDAYLSRRSLVAFRSRVVGGDSEGKLMRAVFDRVAQTAIEALGLSVTGQRLDSTHVVSNIRTRGRGDLFAKTLHLFVRSVEQELPDRWERLPKAVQGWYGRDRDGVFGWGSVEEARTRQVELARWLVAVRNRFAGDEAVRALEPYRLVERVIAEHITVEEALPVEGAGDPTTRDSTPPATEPSIEVHALEEPGSSMQSPFDPDAGYGHKGPGYEVQLTETCGNGSKPEILVDFDVHRSGVSDCGQAEVVLDRLAEVGRKPDTLIADGAYTTSRALEDANKRGVDLAGPVGTSKLPDTIVGRDQWGIDAETGRLAVCPMGQEVLRHGMRTITGRPRLHAFMDGAVCQVCPLAGSCLARSPGKGLAGTWFIEDTPGLRLRDARLAEQKTEAWAKRYAIRSGIEATNSELKRRHGLGRLRVRRLPRVRLAVAARVTACNIKRWLRGMNQ